MANTVIFKWNPAISSFSMYSYLDGILYEELCGNWSAWDYELIHKGDIFYMLKVGKGQTGIVMQGKITKEPYLDEDWSGQGRKTYYCDYTAQIMMNPDTFSLLTSERLQEAIPDFDWFGGHSGIVLEKQQASKLNALWQEYLQEMKEEFQSRLELIERREMDNDQLCIAATLGRKLFGK